MKNLALPFLLLCFIGFQSCSSIESNQNVAFSEPQLPDETPDYLSNIVDGSIIFQLNNPSNGTEPFLLTNSTIGFNSMFTSTAQVSNEGAQLGRVLFYDTQLSLNNTVSCGTCHIQSKGFSDGLAHTTGFAGKETIRNTMPISNLANNIGFFWGNNVSPLQSQVLNPVKNHIEMGMSDMDQLTARLDKLPYYPALFEKAFGTTEITEERISHAITQFLASMVTTPFPREATNQLETHGSDLFNSVEVGCASCHILNSFSTTSADYGSSTANGNPGSNIGLDVISKDAGNGNFGFKIPNLRNIALTAPYMHDGRFETLEAVIEHYNSGIKPNSHLDRRLRDADGAPKRLHLTEYDKSALVAFLGTFTDTEFVTDTKLSDPFQD